MASTKTTTGVTLVCASSACANAGTCVPVWRAQQHRERSGRDRTWSDVGWPRPVLQARPVPYLVPVTAGRPWSRLTHGERLLRCQQHWACQVCGPALPDTAWVLIDPHGQVSSDTALHEHCLQLASTHCPHLHANTALRPVRVQRTDIHADGTTLPAEPVPWRQRWTLPQP